MAVRFIVLVLMFATIILVDVHYFKEAGCNTMKKCYALAWTGMTMLIMGSLIYMIYRG